MVKLRWIAIVIVIVGLSACKSQQPASSNYQIEQLQNQLKKVNTRLDSIENILLRREHVLQQSEHDSLLFSLRRTACLGNCPVFTLDVYYDGWVKYVGKNYVDLMGIYTGNLSKNQISYIKKAFSDAGFYKFKNQYNDGRLDIPATIIEYNGPGGIKKVEARTDIPRPFRLLANDMESLVNEINWTAEKY